MTAAISLINGCFSYGDREIFHELNLEVSPGEILCILGANGCGKTTLLRCLGGSLTLKQGKVSLGNEDLSRMKPEAIARKVGFVFQEHETPFPYSVMEVVCMGRAPHLGLFGSPSESDRKIAETALNRVGMLHLQDKPYTQVSGGERQLVLIARTLAQQPDIIMMDEPTSHLDFKNQVTILKIVNQLARQGMAVLMTSHYPDHALLFSSRVALMKEGAFISVGDPAEAITAATLGEIYGMEVSLISAKDPGTGRDLKLCVPRIGP